MAETLAEDPPIERRPSIRLAQSLLHYYLHGYHGIRYLSPCPLPAQGPAILICNHISSLDPLILQSACPRLITWMMAKEYYDVRALTWLFKLVRAIPVERTGRDLAATRTAIRALEQGQILGVFPEGRIGLNHEVQPFQTGVALVAIKAGVPVYPAYLEGSMRQTGMAEAFLYPQRGTVRFGPPIAIDPADSSRQAIEAATNAFHAAVAALKSPLGFSSTTHRAPELKSRHP